MVRNEKRLQTLSRLAFILLIVLVAVLSVSTFPTNAPPGNQITRMIATLLFGDASHADKVGHFLAYFVLGGAAVFAALVRQPLWAAPALLALYGAGLEGVQHFVPGRYADVADAAVNSLGAALGYFGIIGLKTLVSRNPLSRRGRAD